MTRHPDHSPGEDWASRRIHQALSTISTPVHVSMRRAAQTSPSLLVLRGSSAGAPADPRGRRFAFQHRARSGRGGRACGPGRRKSLRSARLIRRPYQPWPTVTALAARLRCASEIEGGQGPRPSAPLAPLDITNVMSPCAAPALRAARRGPNEPSWTARGFSRTRTRARRFRHRGEDRASRPLQRLRLEGRASPSKGRAALTSPRTPLALRAARSTLRRDS